MSRRKKEPEASGGAPGWMTTFSDLMSLLLTFFILLFSMSSVSSDKFNNMASSLNSVFSSSGGGSESILEHQEVILDMSQQYIENKDMYEKVSEYLDGAGLEDDISVGLDSKGVFVEMKEAILFEPGSATLKDEGLDVLKKLEGLIGNFKNDLVVEGYTDDVPMSSPKFPTNWELSTARAVSVVRYLSEMEGVEPERLSAVGYGEYRPIKPNDSAENRASNRRVNILIIFDEESDD